MTVEDIVLKLDHSLNNIVLKHNTDALVVGIVRKGQMVWEKSYSSRNCESHIDFSSTVFSVQSLSKTFTALAVLKTVEQGLLHLDDTIRQHIPEMKLLYHGCDLGGHITLKQLLSHQSGIQREAPIGNNYDHRFTSFEDHISSIRGTNLKFVPGERYSYSNLNFDLLGYILSVIYEQPFASIMNRLVFSELEMSSSFFDSGNSAHMSEVISGHWEGIRLHYSPVAMVPSCGMFSTLKDLSRFMEMATSFGKYKRGTFLSEALFREMLQPQFVFKETPLGPGLGINNLINAHSRIHYHTGRGAGYYAIQQWSGDTGLILMANEEKESLIMDLEKEVLFYNSMESNGNFVTSNGLFNIPTIKVMKEFSEQFVGSYCLTETDLLHVAFRENLLMVSFDSKLTWEEMHFIEPTLCYTIETCFMEFVFFNEKVIGVRTFSDTSCLFCPRNDSIYDLPGDSDSRNYMKYIGEYEVATTVELSNKRNRLFDIFNKRKLKRIFEFVNGHLYLDRKFKLHELQPGFFIKADGETIEFASDKAIIGNVEYKRKYK